MLVCLLLQLSCHRVSFLGNSTQRLCRKCFVISAYTVTHFSLAYTSETAAAARLTCSKTLNSVWLIHLEAHTTSLYPSVYVLLCKTQNIRSLELTEPSADLPALPSLNPSRSFQLTRLHFIHSSSWQASLSRLIWLKEWIVSSSLTMIAYAHQALINFTYFSMFIVVG